MRRTRWLGLLLILLLAACLRHDVRAQSAPDSTIERIDTVGWTPSAPRDSTPITQPVLDTVGWTIRWDSLPILDTIWRRVPPAPPPGGLAQLTDWGFDAKSGAGWADRGDANYSLVSDPSAPASPPSIGQARFPKGTSIAGRGPIQVYYIFAPKKTIVLDFWLKLDASWYGHPSNVNKIWHIWIAGGNRVLVTAYGKGTGPLTANVGVQALGVRRTVNCPAHQASCVSWDLRSSVPVVRGRWQHWVLTLTANTPGKADGTATLEVDGKNAGRATDLGFCSAAEASRCGFTRVDWNPTWGGGTGVLLPHVQVMQMDHVIVSGR